MIGRLRVPWWLRGLAALLLLAALASCSASPPDATNKAANALPGAISDARKANDAAKANFPALLKQAQYAFIASYTPVQQHADRFGQASTKLDAAKTAYDKTVKPLVDNYDSKRQTELTNNIAAVNTLIGDAKKLTADPPQWLAKVAATKANPDGTVRDAASATSNIVAGYTPLRGDVDAAKTKYARNAGVIETKFQPLTTAHADALQANGQLQEESKKTPPNYALMTEYATTVSNASTTFKAGAPDFKGKLAQLDVRETHTLMDIRVDSEITIDRTTWDDSQDWPDEHDTEYPSVPVDQDTASYFAKFKVDDDVLAKDSTAWLSGGFSTDKADRAQWDKLHINPRDPKWHSGDDTAEFYLGEIEDTYCNKVKVLKDGQPDLSGRPATADNYCSKYDVQADLDQGIYWEESDELDSNAIGMDIYSKGLGDFADQADEDATPPGMVYVGDTSTGEWRQDSHGNSFWEFYGKYRFFSDLIGGPTPYHYRYEYDDWNRGYRYGHKPYYSTYNGQPRYGLHSPLTQSRFPNSTFVRSGVFNSTVRGAGPAARGGGPGGGGK